MTRFTDSPLLAVPALNASVRLRMKRLDVCNIALHPLWGTAPVEINRGTEPTVSRRVAYFEHRYDAQVAPQNNVACGTDHEDIDVQHDDHP